MVKNICFIPLRQGSKSIPEKNIKVFRGKPLFCYVLNSIIESKIADEIWIATNCEKVIAILRTQYPKINIFKRSEDSAKDEAATIEVVLEFLSYKRFNASDRFILFQATSPLTRISDIELLAKKLVDDSYDSFISCSYQKKFRWSEDGIPLDYQLGVAPRRQDYKGFLIQTGSFYASKIGDIQQSKQLLSGKIGIVEVGAHSNIDIDEPIDWILAEAYAAYLDIYGSD